MAEIQFERRGRPLWLVVLILFVVVGGGYFGWTSCATLQRQRTLEPSNAPATAPATAPVTGSGAGPTARP